MNFQHVTPGVYDYINIGSWHEGMLSLDEDMFQMNRSDMVRSVCSEPCSKGEIKVMGQSGYLASFSSANKINISQQFRALTHC